ncbi:FKBP-type peptidyl-prolyl cis-trans isomerase [Streptomyces sp. NBC_00237]|uniref:FKBP-type peptidyl-prolyl cis-trans isomerase n=1 Tax=Streptomyces sp. NBC_00237 TaxID=2975687 RepID=UPI0022590AD3|nr:FKBP-type peptidyl-prolyl cis-trans isomerase [Streptomyces sp. NBC_00237]MCX5202292.1 FKBP-type peptidyl-prolyl cis-trans isomerase [Streptomyces sp. NBC_00237]
MILKKTARRAAVALAVPALFLTAACGSDTKDGKDDGSKTVSAEAVAKVSGKFGDEPKIDVAKDAKAPDKVVVKTVSEGTGAAVTKTDIVRLDFAGKTMKGQTLGSTWMKQPGADPKAARMQVVQDISQPGQMLPSKVMESLAGKKVGSRVEIEGTAKALIGEQLNPQSGITPQDGLVWVVDIVGAKTFDKKAEAKGEQAAPAEGMPEVKAAGQKAATITVPKGEKAPKELKEQILIKGSGAEVKAGEGLVAQYTGVKWEDGKKFDSSWDHGGATAFPIGVGGVIPGWDKGLVGKHVGDRVLLSIPVDQAYGKSQGHELAKNNLVFVIDIVGTV